MSKPYPYVKTDKPIRRWFHRHDLRIRTSVAFYGDVKVTSYIEFYETRNGRTVVTRAWVEAEHKENTTR